MHASSRSWLGQAVQNRLIALVLAMIVIVPFVAAPADASLRGAAALAFEGFALALLALLLWRVRWNLQKERLRVFFRTGVNLPVLLLMGLILFSCAMSPHKAYSAQETLRLIAGALLYFVVAYQFRRSEQLSKLVDTLLALTITMSLFGLAQHGMGTNERATGLFGESQLFGSFLMILLPVVAVVAVTEKAQNRQLAAQIAVVLMAACLLLTHERSSWLGAAVGLASLGALAVFTTLKSRRPGLPARRHEVVLPAMLLVVSAGFFLLLSPSTGSILERASTLQSVSKDHSWRFRQDFYWRGAAAMIRERPLTGFGIGLYPYYQPQYAGGAGVSLACGPLRPHMSEQAHNFYLQTAAELGLPGLLLTLTLLAKFLASGFWRVRAMEPGIRRSLLLGALASVAGFMVDAFSSPSWQYGQVSMFLWLVLGLGVACMRPASRRSEEPQVVPLPARVTRPATVLMTLALAALLPTVVYAGGGGGISGSEPCAYNCPVSGTLTSPRSVIRGGQLEKFTFQVAFCSDPNTLVDVSDDKAHVAYAQAGGTGQMVGTPTRRFYQSRLRERSNPTVTATYTQAGCESLSASKVIQVTP